MRKYFGAAAVVVFLMAFALALWGGNRSFQESPISTIPSILIDIELNETAIYIHGLNDFRYTNMTVRITHENTTFEKVKYDAYFIDYNSSEANFTMNVTVWNRNKEYAFNGSIQRAPDEAAPRLLTLYEEKKDRINMYVLNAGNLPWKKLMERIE
jgi:hypothetical protein